MLARKYLKITALVFPLPKKSFDFFGPPIKTGSSESAFHIKNGMHPNGYIPFLVRETGLEPVRVAPHAPQTCASADSATLASTIRIISKRAEFVNTFLK